MRSSFPRGRWNRAKQVTRYIAEEASRGRAADWLGTVTDSTVTLETHPYAFPLVGEFEGVRIRARSVMRHVLYYFVDESANTVTIVDVVHSARASERERYEGG